MYLDEFSYGTTKPRLVELPNTGKACLPMSIPIMVGAQADNGPDTGPSRFGGAVAGVVAFGFGSYIVAEKGAALAAGM